MACLEDNVKTILSELAAVCERIDQTAVDALVKSILAAPNVFVAGAGRSGLMLRSFAMRLMHLGMRVSVVGETVTPAVDRKDLLLIGSGSGETGSLVMMSRKAKEVGARVVLLTINPGSTIASLADVVLSIAAPSPKLAGNEGAVLSVQPMGTLFEQSLLLVLDAIVMELMAESGKTSEVMFRRHANLE